MLEYRRICTCGFLNHSITFSPFDIFSKKILVEGFGFFSSLLAHLWSYRLLLQIIEGLLLGDNFFFCSLHVLKIYSITGSGVDLWFGHEVQA